VSLWSSGNLSPPLIPTNCCSYPWPRQTLYHRRVRDRNCYVGDQPKAAERVVKNCVCMANDFEWWVCNQLRVYLASSPFASEFNHGRDASGECVLVSGLQSLPDDDSCKDDDDYWYERTPYRKIPHSTCEGGTRLDRGSPHICPGFKAHSAFFWFMIFLLPFGFTSLIGYWYYRRSGMARGCVFGCISASVCRVTNGCRCFQVRFDCRVRTLPAMAKVRVPWTLWLRCPGS
jgi:hypothetical protein